MSRTPGDASRNGGHQQGGGQRKPAAGHITADPPERLDPLLDRDAGHDFQIPVLRNLPEGDARDVARGLADGAAHVGWHGRRGRRHLVARDLERRLTPSNRLAKPSSARSPPTRTRSTISATRRSNDRSAERSRASTRDQRLSIRRFDDPHSWSTRPQPARPATRSGRSSTPPRQSTILLSGYSTMPCALASLSRGMRSRTVFSSMIVLTATHSSSLSDEMVGR